MSQVYKICDMPMILKSREWLKDKRHFNLTDEEINGLPAFEGGQYGLVLVKDASLLEDLRRRELTRRYNDHSRLKLDQDGSRLFALFKKLMAGTLTIHKMAKFNKDIELLNQLTAANYKELQKRFSFPWGADEVAAKLYSYWPERFRKGPPPEPPKFYFSAVANLYAIHGEMQPRRGRPRKNRRAPT